MNFQALHKFASNGLRTSVWASKMQMERESTSFMYECIKSFRIYLFCMCKKWYWTGLFFAPCICYSLVIWALNGKMEKKVQLKKSLIRIHWFRLNSNILIGIAMLDWWSNSKSKRFYFLAIHNFFFSFDCFSFEESFIWPFAIEIVQQAK